MSKKGTATAYAIGAAALYSISAPLSKQLLLHIPPTMLAALLYLGAGIGLCLFAGRDPQGEKLTRKELPYTIGMILLDIAAPILLMYGMRSTNSASVSLLNNFEIVATSLIALLVFREILSRHLWLAIGLVTLASILLSFESADSFRFNRGSLLVLGATVCWGFENNCTRMLSNKSSVQITTIKGIFSGLGSLSIALCMGESAPAIVWLAAAMALGFVSYGLSIRYYIQAQKELGAAKTSAYYALAPFLGVLLSMLVFGERPAPVFYLGLILMGIATILMIQDSISLQHTHRHSHTHTHAHSHGGISHTHAHSHVHEHTHIHGADETTHSHTHEHLDGHDHSHNEM